MLRKRMLDWAAVLVTLSISFDSCLTYESFFSPLVFFIIHNYADTWSQGKTLLVTISSWVGQVILQIEKYLKQAVEKNYYQFWKLTTDSEKIIAGYRDDAVKELLVTA